MPNRLANESSPYLLQHAHNPVDWYPWGRDALEKAIREAKPILVSIGYSACHWCHVMERECFEKEEIARIMNASFVCIKVDREERPDIDAIYMDAIQAMGIQGGWPLNVFLMPNANPFYGVTYLPQHQWGNLLHSVRNAFDEHHDQITESAEGFTKHLNRSIRERYSLTDETLSFTREVLKTLYDKVSATFDTVKGGTQQVPKFPMPSIYKFLLAYYHITQNEPALTHICLTLDRIALGGIYDQLGGGFARYSVDANWFAPHFEKMLYDNGQLLTLYAEAYSLTKSNLYRKTVYQTIQFLQNELTSPEGGFYSALDADSEGEEGLFYTWTTPELEDILQTDFNWFQELYHIAPEGNWEHGRNILHRTLSDEAFVGHQELTQAQFVQRLESIHNLLLNTRRQRVRPSLDDKILCSWNGLILKGLTIAYRVFNEASFLQLAKQNAQFIQKKFTDPVTGRLWHSYKNEKATLIGYLEDYAAVIDAYLALYQATFEEGYLIEADRLTTYVIDNFWDTDDHLFFFTDVSGEALITRKKEVFDNVIPSSNSMMAHNLYTLSLLLSRPNYMERLNAMSGRIQPLLLQNTYYLTHWATLYALRTQPTAEIAIVGPEANRLRQELDSSFYPNKIVAGTTTASLLPLLENRSPINEKTTIYVCYNRTCLLPVTSIEKAKELLMIGTT